MSKMMENDSLKRKRWQIGGKKARKKTAGSGTKDISREEVDSLKGGGCL